MLRVCSNGDDQALHAVTPGGPQIYAEAEFNKMDRKICLFDF